MWGNTELSVLLRLQRGGAGLRVTSCWAPRSWGCCWRHWRQRSRWGCRTRGGGRGQGFPFKYMDAAESQKVEVCREGGGLCCEGTRPWAGASLSPPPHGKGTRWRQSLEKSDSSGGGLWCWPRSLGGGWHRAGQRKGWVTLGGCLFGSWGQHPAQATASPEAAAADGANGWGAAVQVSALSPRGAELPAGWAARL